jgi:hypothetical protein
MKKTMLVSLISLLGLWACDRPPGFSSDGDEDAGSADSDGDGDTDGDSDGDGDGDSDTDADTDGDTDADSDGDTDADSDADTDSDADGDMFCEMQLGGTCVPNIDGCASCGMGATPHSASAGCGDDSWCCLGWQPPTTECEKQGGVCIPVTPQASCPTGWEGVYTPCGGMGATCCMPGPECVAPIETCEEHDGICTDDPWSTCPSGYQPYGDDLALNCDWRCCVPAPPGFSCNEDDYFNCIAGDACPACWAPPRGVDLKCEKGRTCCAYVCEMGG